MNQQPEALRLADELEEMVSRVPMRNSDDDDDLKCAAELRRLYAENESLRTQLKHAELAASAEAAIVDELQAELQEQARVNGMGGERELKLMAEKEVLLEALQNLIEGFRILKDSDFPALAKARATISAIKGQQ